MAEIDPDQLRDAVQNMHGGTRNARLIRTRPRDIRRQNRMGRRGARLRPDRISDRDSRLRLVLADRGDYHAAVLRGAASTASR